MVKTHEPSLAEWLFWTATLAIVSLAFAESCQGAAPRESSYLLQVTDPTGENGVGSSTLVCVNEDRTLGLLISCGHMFSDGHRLIVAQGPDGNTHQGDLLELNKEAELSAIAITNPGGRPSGVSARITNTALLAGFGQYNYQERTARYLGPLIDPQLLTASSKCEDHQFSGPSRQGDSGGPVFNTDGHLVAVIWGCSPTDTRTVTTSGRLFLDFVARNASRMGFKKTQWCPDGSCRQTSQGWKTVPSYTTQQPTVIPQQRPSSSQSSPPPSNQHSKCCIEQAAAIKKANELIANIQASSTENSKAIEALAVQVNQIVLQPGQQGEKGPKGDKGEPGKDAEIKIDEIVSQVIAQMPPILVERIVDGKKVADGELRPGETMQIIDRKKQ